MLHSQLTRMSHAYIRGIPRGLNTSLSNTHVCDLPNRLSFPRIRAAFTEWQERERQREGNRWASSVLMYSHKCFDDGFLISLSQVLCIFYGSLWNALRTSPRRFPSLVTLQHCWGSNRLLLSLFLFVYQMIDLSFIEAQQDFNDASKIRQISFFR